MPDVTRDGAAAVGGASLPAGALPDRPAGSAPRIIEIRSISKTFPAEKQPIFSNLSLDIGEAEFVAFVGTTGCGKSTLLHMIGGLDSPDGGQILIRGTELAKLSGSARARFLNEHVGFIFQAHHLLPEQTAIANVMLPMRIGGWAKAKAHKRAADLLEKLGLKERLHARPTTLSGGEKQRVAIARALAVRPGVILADEPTGSLNPDYKEDVFTSLLELSRGERATVVMVTHDISLIHDQDKRLRVDRMVDVAALAKSSRERHCPEPMP